MLGFGFGMGMGIRTWVRDSYACEKCFGVTRGWCDGCDGCGGEKKGLKGWEE